MVDTFSWSECGDLVFLTERKRLVQGKTHGLWTPKAGREIFILSPMRKVITTHNDPKVIRRFVIGEFTRGSFFAFFLSKVE